MNIHVFKNIYLHQFKMNIHHLGHYHRYNKEILLYLNMEKLLKKIITLIS